jgi:hypothetical protein
MSVRDMERLGKTSKAYMYAVHIRIDGGKIGEKLIPRKLALNGYR